MTSDINSLAGEALKTIKDELPTAISADEAAANSGLILVLATTLMVIYIGLVFAVGLPVNQEEGAAPAEFIDLPIDDIPHSGAAQETFEQPEINQSDESEKEKKEEKEKETDSDEN
ncbi:hypothetical protein PVX_118675 [Plasmodium vivax]|uniref:Uncharacterized protein n=2 Tax=Plasmodium vivax TaxID=5855 RepID=A5K447_PLAVS|nr:hypothetical protein PVX_118675 [Plasmodium vivax]EDL46301.1 hypothetical protein PVX_118675 [Plasmodium vivax]KMZ87209.1 hypothetical protein PVBG_03994 [Plasmodium vivax Brazil I]|eukprot:XP_001616028.1 hypothetical protein [Plasmodium vivax Sal-1]